MNKSFILVVKDNAPIHSLITTTLETHDYRYLTASTGEAAILETSSHNPDIVLLDLGLPNMDGMKVIKKIRIWPTIPTVVINARGEDVDKVEAPNAETDGYLTRPFSVEKLLARLRATIRRFAVIHSNPPAGSTFANGALRINFATGCAYLRERELHLTPMEYKLLCFPVQNTGKVLTHTLTTQKIWGSIWDNNIASLRVFMVALRKKIERESDSPQHIQTHIGIGYRMIKVG